MATKPTTLPEWASDGGADVVEPSLGQKQDGWDVNDRPPAGWFNWWMKLVWNWVQYLNDAVFTTATTNATCVTATGNGSGAGGNFTGGTTGHGVVGTGGATSGNGGNFQGAGTNSGIIGTGGSAGGRGVSGVGLLTASGVRGTGGVTDAPGVEGIANASGNGIGTTGAGAGSGAGGSFSGGATNGSTGVLGTSTATNGNGATFTGTGTGYGVKGVGIAGYGSVAESDTTSPAKAALRIVPQDTDPSSSPAAGDVYVQTTGGKFNMHNGAGFDRYVPQSFATTANSGNVTSTSLTAYDQSYTIPANSLRVGSTLRIKVIVYANTSAQTFGAGIYIGSTAVVGVTFTRDAGQPTAWSLDCTVTMRSIGGSGVFIGHTIAHHSDDSTGPEITNFPQFIGTSNASPPTIDTTTSNIVTVKAQNTSGSSATFLRQVVIDIT